MAEYLPLHKPGEAITRTASATITAGQLVSVSGAGTVAPSGATDIAWLGVAGFDAASGATVTVYCAGTQRIVTGTGGVTAGQLVHSASPGTVVSHTPGTSDSAIVGVALTTATVGNAAEIQMER
jgi:hypothetical protein